MKREFFNTQFAALMNAYTIAHKLGGEAQDVYWEMLKDIPEREFAYAVRYCLGSCRYFPTIAELGEAAFPTREELGPYNPYRYTEPRQVGWYEQVQRLQKKITSGNGEDE
jgi:hypothetical protein